MLVPARTFIILMREVPGIPMIPRIPRIPRPFPPPPLTSSPFFPRTPRLPWIPRLPRVPRGHAEHQHEGVHSGSHLRCLLNFPATVLGASKNVEQFSGHYSFLSFPLENSTNNLSDTYFGPGQFSRHLILPRDNLVGTLFST